MTSPEYKKNWYLTNRERIRARENSQEYKTLRNERIYFSKLMNELKTAIKEDYLSSDTQNKLYFAYNQAKKLKKLKKALKSGGQDGLS